MNMEVYRTKSFTRDFLHLPRTIKQQFEAKLGLFLLNPFYPSLHTKKMQGTRTIWEARVTRGYRFTFSVEGHVCILRRIGTHDILRTP